MKVLSPGAGTLPLSIGGLDPPTQSYRIIHTLRHPRDLSAVALAKAEGGAGLSSRSKQAA